MTLHTEDLFIAAVFIIASAAYFAVGAVLGGLLGLTGIAYAATLFAWPVVVIVIWMILGAIVAMASSLIHGR